MITPSDRRESDGACTWFLENKDGKILLHVLSPKAADSPEDRSIGYCLVMTREDAADLADALEHHLFTFDQEAAATIHFEHEA